MDYDAYIQPSAQVGTGGRVELIIADRPVTAVDFHTSLLP